MFYCILKKKKKIIFFFIIFYFFLLFLFTFYGNKHLNSSKESMIPYIIKEGGSFVLISYSYLNTIPIHFVALF